MSRHCASVLLFSSLVLWSTRAVADPRWWQDEQPALSSRDEPRWPHLVRVDSGPFDFVLVWSERDVSAVADYEVAMTGSVDGGCTWCPPVLLTDNDLDDTHPRVAVTDALIATTPGTHATLRVLHETPDGIGSIWGELSADAATACTGLAALAQQVRDNNQREVLRSGAPRGFQPDIAALDGTFHAVWRLTGFALGDGLEHAWTQSIAPWQLGPDLPRNSLLPALPVIAVDRNADTPADRALGVLFLDENLRDVRYLRSTDSGQTWQPVGAEVINGQGVAALVRPSLSVTDDAWVGAGWIDESGVWGGAWFDALHLQGPLTPDLPWGIDTRIGMADNSPQSARMNVVLGSLAGSAWATAVWTSGGETFTRSGVLDHLAAMPVNFASTPFVPERPGEPALTTGQLISACAFQPATWECTSDRGSGEAMQVTAAGGEPGSSLSTVAAWIDTRGGANGDVWSSRTDVAAAPVPAPQLTPECDNGSPALRVRFQSTPDCAPDADGQPELLRRFLVHHGTAAGGPYTDPANPVVVTHDPAVSAHEIVLTGLAPATEYWVAVIPEDEARNVSPPTFDPTAFNAGVPGQGSAMTRADCQTCLYRATTAVALAHDPSLIFVTPRQPGDLAIPGAPLRCPFVSGDRDVGVIGDGLELRFYQVDQPVDTLRVTRAGSDVVITH